MDTNRWYCVGQESYTVIAELGGGRFVATRERGGNDRFLITEVRPTGLSERDLDQRLRWTTYRDELAKLDAVESSESCTVIVERLGRGIPATRLPLPLDQEQALSVIAGFVWLLESLHSTSKRGTLLGRIQPALIYVDFDGPLPTLASVAPRVHALAPLEKPPSTFDEDIARFGRMPFIPPEAAAGKKAKKAGDVFLAGCLLHWLTTGEEPVEGLCPPDLPRLLEELRAGHIRPYHGPSAVGSLLLRAMAAQPEKRPPLPEFRARLDELRSEGSRQAADREARITSPTDWVSPHATEASARMALGLDDVGVSLRDRLRFALNARWFTQRQLLELGLGWALDAVAKVGTRDASATTDAKRLLKDARFLIESADLPAPDRLPALLQASRKLRFDPARNEVPLGKDPIALADDVVEGVVHWTCVLMGLPPLCGVPGAPANTECLLSDSELNWAQLRGEKSGPIGWAAKVGIVHTYEDHNTVTTGRVLYGSLIAWLTEVAERSATLLAGDLEHSKEALWTGLLRDVEAAIGA